MLNVPITNAEIQKTDLDLMKYDDTGSILDAHNNTIVIISSMDKYRYINNMLQGKILQ